MSDNPKPPITAQRLFDAAEYSRRWAEEQRGMAALAETLAELGSLEQAIFERKAGLEKASGEYESKLADVKTAQADLAKLQGVKADTVAAIDAMLAKGREQDAAESKEIIDRARQAAADMIAKANGEVASIQAAHADAMRVATADLDSTNALLVEAKAALEKATADRAALQQEISAMIAAAQRAIG